MRTRTVRTAPGPSFDVAVQWAPRWARVIRRLRRRHRPRGRSDVGDVLDVATIDEPAGAVVWLVGVLVFLVGIVLVWSLLVPLLLIVVDLLVVVAVLAVAIVVRALLRRPWTVAVTPAGDDEAPAVARADVLGWRRALRVRDAIAAGLAAGSTPAHAVQDAAGTDKRVTVLTAAAGGSTARTRARSSAGR